MTSSSLSFLMQYVAFGKHATASRSVCPLPRSCSQALCKLWPRIQGNPSSAVSIGIDGTAVKIKYGIPLFCYTSKKKHFHLQNILQKSWLLCRTHSIIWRTWSQNSQEHLREGKGGRNETKTKTVPSRVTEEKCIFKCSTGFVLVCF